MSEEDSGIQQPTEHLFQSLDDCLNHWNMHDSFMLQKQLKRQGQGSPTKKRKTQNLVPIIFCRVKTQDNSDQATTAKGLLDTGGSGCLVTRQLVKNLKTNRHAAQTNFTTAAGNYTSNEAVRTQFTIPELHDDRIVEWKFHVADELGPYDLIIGRDLLRELQINLHFDSLEIEWDEARVPMRDSDATIETSYHVHDSQAVDEATKRIKEILDAKYEKISIKEVVAGQTHLNKECQTKLKELLTKFEDLFDGTLGRWNGPSYEIELKEGAKPYHARAYPIPKVHERTLRMEVERLCKAGVLKKVNRSEWAAPTFILPKKDGTVRFINDFRELNKRIKRKPFPIPKIQDLLLKLEGFQFATSLDLNMGYYHIELSPNSRKLCTIVLPWGKYEMQRLPMGLCNSPDIFQERMSTLFEELEYVRCYIDDPLIITTDTLDDHLEKLEEVFQRLRQAGLKVNAKKSFIARAELEYLGYWITRNGISPVPKKINAIQAMKPPTNKKELRKFIGIVNYYRDMWVRRSEVLAPLSALTSKNVKWTWGEEQQQAFETMKKIYKQTNTPDLPRLQQTV